MVNSPPIVAFVPREVFSTTRRSLDRLLENTAVPFDLVCVDGNSPPETRDYLRKKAAEQGFAVLRTEKYLTPNQSRNLALKWARENHRAEFIVFLDNDVLVGEDWLPPLLACAEETGAGLVGPVYFEHLPEFSRIHMFGGTCGIRPDESGRSTYFEKHDLQHTPVASIDEPLTRRRTQLIEFHAVLARMELFEKIGPLDEGLLCHAEHGDLSMLAEGAGYEIWLEPSSRITYVPPKRLDPGDRDYFFLRWSDTWAEANQAHFMKKWGLDHIVNENGRGLQWVQHHRRHGYHALRPLRTLLGPKWSRSLEKRLFLPFEKRWNRRRYPRSQWAELSSPEVSVFPS